MPLWSRPIDCLPFEILAEIFQHAAEAEVRLLERTFWRKVSSRSGFSSASSSTWVQWPGPSSSLYHVQQVCRAWRGVAISTPYLWTDVFVAIRRGGRPGIQAASLQAILRRSYSAPLRIRFQADGDPACAHAGRIAISIILAYRLRLTFLDIGLPFAEPLRPITLPRLYHLSLHTRHSTQRGAYVPPGRGDDAALLWFTHVTMPSLCHFEYYGDTIYPPTMLHPAVIPWPAITTLHLSPVCVSWKNILQLLAAVKMSIQTLRVVQGSSSRRAYRAPLPPIPVRLPVLQYAHFDMEWPDLFAFVAAIQAPALRHVHLQKSFIFIGDRPPTVVQVHASIANISSARSSLTRLALIDVNLAYTALHSLLVSLDALEHVTLRYCPSASSTTEAYYPDATNVLRDWTSSSLSPNLHHLTIMSNTWSHAPPGTLLQLVRTRCQPQEARRLGVCVLRHVIITRRYCRAHSDTRGDDESRIGLLDLRDSIVMWTDADRDSDCGYSFATETCRICHPAARC